MRLLASVYEKDLCNAVRRRRGVNLFGLELSIDLAHNSGILVNDSDRLGGNQEYQTVLVIALFWFTGTLDSG